MRRAAKFVKNASKAMRAAERASTYQVAVYLIACFDTGQTANSMVEDARGDKSRVDSTPASPFTGEIKKTMILTLRFLLGRGKRCIQIKTSF